MTKHPPTPRLPRALDLLAFGFGTGRSPKAPGTAGSALAVLWFAALASMPLAFYAGWVVVAALLGIIICGEAAKAMGVHDHPGIVWDEFVGQWIALMPLVPFYQAFTACVLPVLLGFVLPAGYLLSLALSETAQNAAGEIGTYLKGSLWLGLATALLCLVAALLLAFARTRSPSRAVAGAIRVATLGYALPGALLAVGLLAPLGAFDQSLTRFARDTFGWSGGLLLTGTSAILVYALSVRFLTVAYNSVSGGLARIPPSLDAAARSLGAGPARVLTRIYAPLLTPSLAGAAALVLIDTLRELPATLILRPFNLETLATRTYRLASDERLVEAAIPALILLAAGLLPVLVLNRLGKR